MELMIAVVVAGILAAVAYPSFTSLIARGRRADAIAVLTSVVQTQERYRSNRSAYADSFGADGLKMVATGTQISSISTISKYYDVSLAGIGATASFTAGYIVTATPKTASPQRNDKDCQVLKVRLNGALLTYLSEDLSGHDTTETVNCWSH